MRHLLALLLPACIGLDTLPDQTDKGGDIDGPPLDSGHPLDSGETGTTGHDDGQNDPPVADAGEDVEATVNLVVELDGSGSSDPDGDALDYQWTIIEQPRGSAASLINADRVDPSFVPDLAGRYVVELTVDDGQTSSDPDEVEVTATSDNGDPVANAGADQTVAIGDTVTLDGSASSDPDGDPLVYAWTLSSRPSGSSAALSGGSTATPRFTADVSGSYVVSLTVTDGTATSAPDEVRVIAEPDGTTSGGSGCGCRTGSPGDAGALVLAVLAIRRKR